jgi:hypothetical protein
MTIYTRTNKGDKLRQTLDHEIINAFKEAAKKSAQTSSTLTGARSGDGTGIITVKNISGASVQRFGILGLGDVLILPDDNLSHFKDAITFKGDTPAQANHFGKFCVVQEPIDDDAIGTAMVSGVTPVLINVLNKDHVWADVEDGGLSRLESKLSASAQILWREDLEDEEEVEEVWAIVRLSTRRKNNLGIYSAQMSTSSPLVLTSNWQVIPWEEQINVGGLFTNAGGVITCSGTGYLFVQATGDAEVTSTPSGDNLVAISIGGTHAFAMSILWPVVTMSAGVTGHGGWSIHKTLDITAGDTVSIRALQPSVGTSDTVQIPQDVVCSLDMHYLTLESH